MAAHYTISWKFDMAPGWVPLLQTVTLNHSYSTLALRAINDQLMQLERAFADINGIEGRETFR